LPSAWRLVSAVNAACPTAGPLLPLQQFVTGSVNTTSARCWLFGVIDPANELISTERGQAFPKRKDFPIRSQCCLKIFTCFVDSALGKSVHHETSQAMPPDEFVSSALNGNFRACPLDNGMSSIGSTGVLLARTPTRTAAFKYSDRKLPVRFQPFPVLDAVPESGRTLSGGSPTAPDDLGPCSSRSGTGASDPQRIVAKRLEESSSWRERNWDPTFSAQS
jgi:hypothetical protein